MSDLALPAKAILHWNDTTTVHWMTLLGEHPAILNLPCDIRASGTAGRLLQHIMAVDLRYAQRLAPLPESPYEAIPFASAGELQATHPQARQIIESLLDDPRCDWSVEIEFQTISAGRLRCTRQAVFIHALDAQLPPLRATRRIDPSTRLPGGGADGLYPHGLDTRIALLN